MYQLVNKRTEILAITTSHIAHLCKLYSHVFALLISMPLSVKLNFIKIGLKLSYFCQKKYNIFERWGMRPNTPETAAPSQISGPALASNITKTIYKTTYSETNFLNKPTDYRVRRLKFLRGLLHKYYSYPKKFAHTKTLAHTDYKKLEETLLKNQKKCALSP